MVQDSDKWWAVRNTIMWFRMGIGGGLLGTQ